MNKDKALESVNEIKELMEKSSKFISISGLAAIMAGVYALAGTYIATCLVTPDTTLITALKLMIIVAILVLAAATVTAGILSYNKSKKLRQKFFSKLTYRALWNFSLPMLTGGALCISLLLHGYYDILSSVMLLFYGLTLVNVSKFTYANIAWLGYAFICLGVIDSLGRPRLTVLDDRFRWISYPLWNTVLFTLRKKAVINDRSISKYK